MGKGGEDDEKGRAVLRWEDVEKKKPDSCLSLSTFFSFSLSLYLSSSFYQLLSRWKQVVISEVERGSNKQVILEIKL